MIPRAQLSELLQQKLQAQMTHEQVAQLVEEIVALENEWEEVDVPHRDMGYSVSDTCSDICWLAEQIDRGAAVKIYRKRKPGAVKQ